MSQSVRVYISGPMSGYPEFNYPAFRAAAERLRTRGFYAPHDVVSPAEIDHGPGAPGSYPSEHYLRNDLRHLIDCEVIALLPGWGESIGARCEVAIALTLGMGFVDAETLQPMERPAVLISGGYPKGVTP